MTAQDIVEQGAAPRDGRQLDLTTSVRVTFDNDRIGRSHTVEPLDVASIDPDVIAEAVYQYARPRLHSRDVEVVVDMEKLTGIILCGFNNGGTFTIEHTSPEVWVL